MRYGKTIGIASLLLLSSALPAGCVALVVGGAVAAGTIAYNNGELVSSEEARFGVVWAATTGAVQEIGLAVESSAHDDAGGAIDARNQDGDKITIRVAAMGDDMTQVRIRVGTFGDEAESHRILTEIRDHY